jgi:hypothetical protein
VFLEAVVRLTGLREIPWNAFAGFWRLRRVAATGCSTLEGIRPGAFMNCRSLCELKFPPSVRFVESAFDGTAIRCVDLSETRAERAEFGGMTFLDRVILPRRCVLDGAYALPSLRSVTFGVWIRRAGLGWRTPGIRFESMKSRPGKELFGGRVSAEVASVLSRESSPSSPP